MKYKTANVIKEYVTVKFGHILVVPVGSIVSNKTACGIDDRYHFWEDFSTSNYFKDNMNPILKHNLTHYGLDIPQEYCEEYKG